MFLTVERQHIIRAAERPRHRGAPVRPACSSHRDSTRESEDPMRHRLKTQILMALFATAMFAGPVRASDFLECVDGVVERCDAALAEVSWWNIVAKIAIGNMCVGLLAGCGTGELLK
jgi:hypothetical protein